MKHTGHTCPHCEERELIIDIEAGTDVPNGPGSYHSPGGFVVRCNGVVSGECNSPDMTGTCKTEQEALELTLEDLKGWKPYCINSFSEGDNNLL